MKKRVIKTLIIATIIIPMVGCSQEKTTTTTTKEPIDESKVLNFEFAENVTFPSEIKVLDELYTSFKITHPNSSETVVYSSSEKNNLEIDFKLYKDGETENIIDQELISNQKYNLVASYQGFSTKATFTADEKVTLLKKEDLTYVCKNVDSDVSLGIGDVKMLVIPVNLTGSWLDDWDISYLDTINDLYFGNDRLSLSSYYKDASNGIANISGMVSEIFDYSSHTSNEIQENHSYLVDMIKSALETIETNHQEIDWREYDLDQNGSIDNLHVVTNFNPYIFQEETGRSAWSTNLWPHMSNLYSSPKSLDKPVARVYSAGVLNHLIGDYSNSAITPIHEQGHIFGLNDYYDYAGLVDYIGSFDMQSSNVLDWNCYSKFCVGWTDAYVVKDECTINISSFANGGKCLIIPANYDTFNNSAYSEFFILELFSYRGNNAKFIDTWNYIFDNQTKGYGIRMYHVDNRFFNLEGKEVYSPKKGMQIISNDSYDYTKAIYSSYRGLQKLADKKLLTLIQKGREDTFGNEEYGTRKYLRKDDLFEEGDTFTFDKYAHFLSKRGIVLDTMDNGELFPYKIDFLKMNSDKATIKVSLLNK